MRRKFENLIPLYPILFRPEFLLMELCLILKLHSVQVMMELFKERMALVIQKTNIMFISQQASHPKKLTGKRTDFESILMPAETDLLKQSALLLYTLFWMGLC